MNNSVLYVVATPIGNLEDISFRALRIFSEVDFILAEDTRVTLKLLNYFKIKKPLISYFQHSKLRKINYILNLLSQNKKLALVSGSGTPGINDPGGKLISKIVEKFQEQVKIIPIPGPNALISALSISGFNVDRFLFLGFPPSKKRRRKFFQEIIESKYPTIFYESPYRILKTLNELAEIENLKERKIVLARELTKKFETIYRGRVKDILEQLKKDQIKGEFVVIINNNC